MTRYVRTVAPANALGEYELQVAKQHLRVEHGDDDLLITGLIRAAEAYLDGRDGVLGRALLTQTWRIETEGPDDTGSVLLDLGPVVSVSAVTLLADDTPTAWTGWRLWHDAGRSFIRPASGESWPSRDVRSDAVQVTFVAGEATLPPPLRAAMLLLIGHWYENRQASTAAGGTMPLPLGVDALLTPYRKVTP